MAEGMVTAQLAQEKVNVSEGAKVANLCSLSHTSHNLVCNPMHTCLDVNNIALSLFPSKCA